MAYRAYKTKATSNTTTVLIDYTTTDSKLLTVSQREKGFYQASQPDGLPAPLTVVGASNYYLFENEPDPPIITNVLPQSIQDWKVITDFSSSQTIPSDFRYRVNPELGFETSNGSSYGDNAVVAGSISATGDIYSENDIIAQARLRAYDGAIIALVEGGSFTIPQVATIATMMGGIAAINIGANEDLHAGISGYANRSFVAGRGAQHFGHDGSFVITTNGSGTAPYSGFARGSIYSDQNGVRYTVLDSTPPYRGSVGNGHNFDSDVSTSKSLHTSETLNIGGSYEGVATILSGNTSVVVSSSVVAETDAVIISYADSSNGGGAIFVEEISPGVEFSISSTGAVGGNTDVNWKIIK